MMRLIRQKNLVLVLLLILSVSLTQTSRVTCETYTVGGFEIRTRLVPDKTTVMLGEPVYVSFIVDNHSDQDLQMLVGGDYRNGLGRPESFTVTVQGEDNRHVTQPDVGPGMGGVSGPVPIPAGGNYAFRLFLPHWATFQEVGGYKMVARRILNLGNHRSDLYDIRTKTIDVQTEASTKLRVVPLDEAKMGNIIDHLGNAMFSKFSYESEEAAEALKYIQDERVIPYFIRASETNRYGLKFSALHALSKFDNESAFLALRNGLESEEEDINILLAAVWGLVRSPHPEAITYLLSKRRHSYEGVRMTVLHAVGEMKPEKAIPILKEMAHDKSEKVSTKAKRYLKLLASND